MKKLAMITMSVAVLASSGVFSNAFAQEKTRAEVRQELIEAQQNGLNYVTDSSYPDVSPVYAQEVSRLKQQAMASSANTRKIVDGSTYGSTAN